MSKREVPAISEAEWQVMNVLWDRSPQTAAEVIDALAEPQGWNPKTVRTLLGRLVQKAALDYEQDGRKYLYRPAVARAACSRVEARSFLDRVFGGAVAPMVAQLAEEGALDGEDLDALRRLLDERAARSGGKGER